MKLFVAVLTSVKTQVPFDYYSLPFCKPAHHKMQSENFGEVLGGDRIENSIYKVRKDIIESFTKTNWLLNAWYRFYFYCSVVNENVKDMWSCVSAHSQQRRHQEVFPRHRGGVPRALDRGQSARGGDGGPTGAWGVCSKMKKLYHLHYLISLSFLTPVISQSLCHLF